MSLYCSKMGRSSVHELKLPSQFAPSFPLFASAPSLHAAGRASDGHVLAAEEVEEEARMGQLAQAVPGS